MIPGVTQFDGEGPGLAPSPAVANNPAASPVTASQSVNTNTLEGIAAASSGPSPLSMTSGMSSGPKPTAPKPIDKSNWDRSTKVSPATVAAVKAAGKGNMGYGAARNAKYGMPGYYGSTFSPNAPASNEYKEAVKRVYPSAYKSVTTPFKPAPGTAGGGKYVGSTFVPNKPASSAFPPILPPVKKK